MLCLPTVPIQISQNVGKYTIHGWHGQTYHLNQLMTLILLLQLLSIHCVCPLQIPDRSIEAKSLYRSMPSQMDPAV